MEYREFRSRIMHWFWNILVLIIFSTNVSSSIINRHYQSESSNKSHTTQLTSGAHNTLDTDLVADDAQGSTNYFTSDLGSDYGGFFEHFPDLPYFPEFGEIFRLSRTTTPQPPYRYPSYVRDAFSDTSGPSSGGSASAYSDSIGSGGRRPSRRPPRPASSRTKVSKQNQSEPKDKGRSLKSRVPIGKSKNFPKIFRFTSDRVNLADFDMKKKVNENYLTLVKGDDLDSDKVKRNEFLILHGGVFEIEPSGRSGLIAASTNHQAEVTSSEALDTSEAMERGKRALGSMSYVSKT